MAAGIVWGGNETLLYRTDADLSDVLRTTLQPLATMRQFTDPIEADKPYHTGDRFYWDIFGDTAQSARALDELEVIPETTFTFTQSSLLVTETGISVPFTAKSEMMAKFQVTDIVHKALSNNARKFFDASAWTQFNATPLVVTPTSGTSLTALTLATTGTSVTTNNVELSSEHINLVDDLMRERNIPPDPRVGRYIATGHPSTFRSLKDDLEAKHIYTETGLNMMFESEMGRYGGFVFVEQTNIPKGGAEDSTTFDAFNNTADAWNNAKSSWVLFFGGDTVMECVITPEEVRAKIPTDFGRSHAAAWYYCGGFGLTHTAAANARVVLWGSAT